MLGPKFRDNFSFLPLVGTRARILIAASDDHFKLISSQRTCYTLTVRIQMLNDDFNLIYKAEDKSNVRLNRRMMGKFKATLDELELKELLLHRRKFTWTGYHHSQNSQSPSTPSVTDKNG
jgi:hypothetical protein